MVLGPEEYVDRRMTNNASTVLAMWRKLVKEANLTELKAKLSDITCHIWCVRYSGSHLVYQIYRVTSRDKRAATRYFGFIRFGNIYLLFTCLIQIKRWPSASHLGLYNTRSSGIYR